MEINTHYARSYLRIVHKIYFINCNSNTWWLRAWPVTVLDIQVSLQSNDKLKHAHQLCNCDLCNCVDIAQYAVKAQTSLAPLSRFRGSHITTAHEQQCCRFQSYAKTVPSRMKLTSELTKREPHSWDPRQRTTWSGLVTSDLNSV